MAYIDGCGQRGVKVNVLSMGNSWRLAFVLHHSAHTRAHKHTCPVPCFSFFLLENYFPKAVMANSTTSHILCVFCEDVSWVVFRIAFGVMVVIFNTVTMIALTRCKELTMSLKYAFASISLSDMLLGITYIYTYTVSVFKTKNDLECKIRVWFISVMSSVALFTLSLLSLDRLISLECPLKYNTFATKRVLLIMTFLCWSVTIISVTWALAMVRDITTCNFIQLLTPEALILFGAVGSLVISSTIGFHLRIYVLARRQIAKILPSMLQEDRAPAAIKLNTKTMVTTAAVLVPFVLCNTPSYISFLCFSQIPDFSTRVYASDIIDILLFLQLLSSFLNPIIYIWRLPGVRNQMKTMVLCHGK